MEPIEYGNISLSEIGWIDSLVLWSYVSWVMVTIPAIKDKTE